MKRTARLGRLLFLVVVGPMGIAPAQAQTSRMPQIAYVVQGQLLVESAGGGTTQPATEVEKQTWRQHRPPSDPNAVLVPISPDGKYKMVRVTSEDDENVSEAFNVVRVSDGKVILSRKDIAKVVRAVSMSRMRLGQWLPDSKTMAIDQRALFAVV